MLFTNTRPDTSLTNDAIGTPESKSEGESERAIEATLIDVSDPPRSRPDHKRERHACILCTSPNRAPWDTCTNTHACSTSYAAAATETLYTFVQMGWQDNDILSLSVIWWEERYYIMYKRAHSLPGPRICPIKLASLVHLLVTDLGPGSDSALRGVPERHLERHGLHRRHLRPRLHQLQVSLKRSFRGFDFINENNVLA